MDSIHLHGAEDVRSAGNTMRNAADEMRSAASTIDDAARRMRETMDEATTAMNRLAEALEAFNAREAAKAERVLRCGHDDARCPTPDLCGRGNCRRRPHSPWAPKVG